MSMRRKNKCKDGSRQRSDYSPWFWPSVLRRRMRKGLKISKRFMRYLKRQHQAAQTQTSNTRREGKMRGLDGTMFGPFRSRGT